MRIRVRFFQKSTTRVDTITSFLLHHLRNYLTLNGKGDGPWQQQSLLTEKKSPFIYQTTGMASTHFFGRMGITCGLYIDGRLIGEIMSKHGFWSRSLKKRDSKFSEKAAEAALYVVYRVLTGLGYSSPATRLQYLGMLIDTNEQAFIVPPKVR